jgi:hypothetical protein
VSSGPGSRRDHDRFCQLEGWEQVRNARGRTGHHVSYRLRLPDGRVLRTRISHPVNNDTYGPSLWRHILTDQLEVTEPVFWACVEDQKLPDRGAAAAKAPANALPAQLAYQLVHDAGIPEAEVAQMDLPRAIQVMSEYWSRPPTT